MISVNVIPSAELTERFSPGLDTLNRDRAWNNVARASVTESLFSVALTESAANPTAESFQSHFRVDRDSRPPPDDRRTEIAPASRPGSCAEPTWARDNDPIESQSTAANEIETQVTVESAIDLKREAAAADSDSGAPVPTATDRAADATTPQVSTAPRGLTSEANDKVKELQDVELIQAELKATTKTRRPKKVDAKRVAHGSTGKDDESTNFKKQIRSDENTTTLGNSAAEAKQGHESDATSSETRIDLRLAPLPELRLKESTEDGLAVASETAAPSRQQSEPNTLTDGVLAAVVLPTSKSAEATPLSAESRVGRGGRRIKGTMNADVRDNTVGGDRANQVDSPSVRVDAEFASPASIGAVESTLQVSLVPTNAGLSSPPTLLADPATALPLSRFAKHLVAKSSDGTHNDPRTIDVDQARFVDRVSRAVRAAESRGGVVTLRLHPPELGIVRVELRIQDGALSARLEAETPTARGLLIDHSQVLRERLAEQGLRVERFDVDLLDQRSTSDSPTFQQRESFERDHSARSRRMPRREEILPLEPSRTPVVPRGNGQLNVIV